MTPLLAFRRARRDLGLLLVWVALVAFAVALAIGQPRLLLQTVDAGARQAVAAAGSATDVLVTADVSHNQDLGVQPVRPGEVEALAAAIPHRLPGALRAVHQRSTLAVVGPATRLSTIDGAEPTGQHPVAVQLAMLTPQNTAGLTLVSGTMPGAAPGAGIDVVLSAASAAASGLTVGNTAQVSTIPVSSAISGGDQVTVHVVGIVRQAPGASTDWTDIPNLWHPVIPKSSSAPVQLTMLGTEAGVDAASSKYENPFTMTLRISLDPRHFTAEREAAVAAELVVLSGHDDALSGGSDAELRTASEIGTALAAFPAQERAAVAQISVMSAGVLGVAAVVLLLVSRLLVLRREAELSLERARGASLPSIASRALLETVTTGVVAVIIGFVVAQLALPGRLVQPALLVFVLLVAILAVPAQTVLAVRQTWTGRRVAANRADRVDAERRVRLRRVAVEMTVIALAAAAFISLATRGLLENQTSGVDPLLACAPLLLAAAITIVVLRAYRWPLSLGIAIGRRSDGALGLLAAVRAQRSIAPLPLLALTLAVALAVGGGLLSSTVAAGQETASWQRVGADARVHTVATDAQVAAIAAAPGVTAATDVNVQDGVQLRLTAGTNFATMIAVDSRFAGFVGSLPEAGASPAGVAALRKLSTTVPVANTLPVVVNRDLASQLTSKNIGIYVGVTFVTIRVVGVTDFSPSGYLASPFLFVDRTALDSSLSKLVEPNLVLVNGPGAAAAVKALGAPASAVHTRAHWLSERRHLALVSGVDRSIGLATAATALLAALALIVTLLAGARERGRSLALIRTLGLPARLGWWLALAELAPVLGAALLGGVVAGLGIVILLAPALGLRELAGGLGNPTPTVSGSLVAWMVLAAIGLLLLAVLIEIAVRRRDRLSEVLRVGE